MCICGMVKIATKPIKVFKVAVKRRGHYYTIWRGLDGRVTKVRSKRGLIGMLRKPAVHNDSYFRGFSCFTYSTDALTYIEQHLKQKIQKPQDTRYVILKLEIPTGVKYKSGHISFSSYIGAGLPAISADRLVFIEEVTQC